MTSLLDIADVHEVVVVRGKELKVRGVSARGVVRILQSFPEFKEMITGREVSMTAEDILSRVPDAVGVLIAAGLGEAGNAETEKLADELFVDEQLGLLEAIMRQTFPRGIASFVERLEGLVSEVTGPQVVRQDDESGKAQGTRSQEPSKAS